MKVVTQQVSDATKCTTGPEACVAKQEISPEDALKLTAQDRVRLTQVLHDDLREYFAALSFHARMVAEDLHRERSAHAAQAEQMIILIRRTNDVMRRLNRVWWVQGAETDDGCLPPADGEP